MVEEYPSIGNRDEEGIAGVVDRIVELQNDFVTEFNGLICAINFNGVNRTDVQEITGTAEAGSNTFHVDVDATGGVVTVDLPTSPISNRIYSIAKADNSGNAVTVDGNGKNINGSATISLGSQYDIAFSTIQTGVSV